MTGEEFYGKRMDETNWDPDNLCDPPTDPSEDWYVVMPESDDQVITVAVAEILDKYPKNRFSAFVKKIWKLLK